MENQILPNSTLYVNNLNEKVKVNELKIDLFHLFSEFGDVLEINARKSLKMKGQAFIVFKDVTSATNAKASLNNSLFLGKVMHIQFAKTNSDTIGKLTGAVDSKEKANIDLQRKRLREEEYKRTNIKTNIKKKVKKENDAAMEEDIDGEALDNNILFVEGLTEEINNKILNAIFGKYKGLKEIRMNKGRGCAFIEYDNEINAGSALVGLNKMKLTENSILKITFAKK